MAAGGEHPFRAAWRTRDLDAWVAALSPDVVMHSPVLSAPFRGRAAAAEVYGVLFAELGAFEIVGELADGDARACFWRARLGDRSIEGVDLLRRDDEGKIAEITVMIRPLADVGAFAAAIGPRLAANRSPARGALAGLLTRPLGALLALADHVAARLLSLR
jgi:ketosteroid isomerase-like protein